MAENKLMTTLKARRKKKKKSPWFVNSSRVHLRTQVRKFSRGTKRGMMVLDAGAGKSPYRGLFKNATYEAADFAKLPWEFLGLVSNAILNGVKGINRVLYDISTKPPASIEWE